MIKDLLQNQKVGRAVPARRMLGITVLEPKGGAEGLHALPCLRDLGETP